MKKFWAALTSKQKRVLVGLATFVVAIISIALIKKKILIPGAFFASFAFPALPLLLEFGGNNIGNTVATIYMSIICGLFAATFAAPIISCKLRILRNVVIAPFIIFGLIFSVMWLSGAAFMGPA